MNFDWRQIFTFTQRMSPRERTLLGLAAGSMLVIGLYSFVWEPLAEGRIFVARRVLTKGRQLEEIQKLREEYMNLLRQLETSQEVLEQADPQFSLFPFIETTVGKLIGRKKIKSMNPESKAIGAGAYREESVELKLTGIELQQLVDMMYQIEKGPHPLRVTRLQVKKQVRDPYSFDVTATVAMLKSEEQ
jgi:general secretion pathway protein M